MTVDGPAVAALEPWVGDVSELTAFLNRCYASLLARGLEFVAATQGDAVTLRRLAGRECWVGRRDGVLVGTVTVTPPGLAQGCAWYERPDVAMFGQFAVEPSLRGSGLGSLLLTHAEQRALALGATELALDTAEPAQDLIAYYARRGFRVVDGVDWPATNFVSVVMSKTLR